MVGVTKLGNWSLSGILLIVFLFLFMVGLLLSLIDVTNPLADADTSVLAWIGDIIIDSLKEAITPW